MEKGLIKKTFMSILKLSDFYLTLWFPIFNRGTTDFLETYNN